MLDISLDKVAHVIVRARECDAKVGAWEDGTADNDADSILEDFADDATRQELEAFINNLNEDEQASLVALAWVGRESFAPDEFAEALDTAKAEHMRRTAAYLLGLPLLADYLEEGLERLGHSVEDVEEDIL